jgi:hypothetical protein
MFSRFTLESYYALTQGRSLTRNLGGAYSYIRALPDGFLLKAIVFTVFEHEYMNIHTHTPIIASSYGPALTFNVLLINEYNYINTPQG